MVAPTDFIHILTSQTCINILLSKMLKTKNDNNILNTCTWLIKYKYMCADLQEISFSSFKGLSGLNVHHNQILETDLSA